MKRVIALGFLLCALAAASHAGQRQGFGGARVGGVCIRAGFGGGFHRGFGGVHRGFGGFHRGFVGGGIRFGSGVHPGFGVARFRGFYPFGYGFHRRSFAFGGFYPLAVPVFVGGYSYAYPPPYAYPSQPVVIVVYPSGPSGERQVQSSAGERDEDRQDNGNTARNVLPPEAERPPTGAIALTNGTVERAVAAWTGEDALHYVTVSGKHSVVPIDQFDSNGTERLNQDEMSGFRVLAVPRH